MTGLEFDCRITKEWSDVRSRLYKYLWSAYRLQRPHADDIIQHALEDLISKEKYCQFQDRHPGSFWGWVKKSVRLSCLQFLKDRIEESEIFTDSVTWDADGEEYENRRLLPESAYDHRTPYQELHTLQVQAAVRRAIRNVPEHLMELLERHYVEGVGIRQLAAEVGSKEKALASSLRRLRDKLRNRLSEYDPYRFDGETSMGNLKIMRQTITISFKKRSESNLAVSAVVPQVDPYKPTVRLLPCRHNPTIERGTA